LRRHEDPAALSRVTHLCLFAPSLTPQLCQYLLNMHETEPVQVAQVWDSLTERHAQSLSEWQSAWLVHVARKLGLLERETRSRYVEAQRLRGLGGLLHAEASLALAEVGGLSFSELDNALRTKPEPLAPWYVLGIKALARDHGLESRRLTAVRESSPLYRLLIGA
jgi:hypothetical protein